jgi:hypothetical protein
MCCSKFKEAGVRKVMIGLMMGLALANLCYASDILSDMATGVPGVKWGEKLADRTDMVWNEEGKYYSKTDENFALPLPDNTALTITKIWYYPDTKGEFSSCIVYASGASIDALKSYVQKRYGEPRVAGGRKSFYVWRSGLLILGKGFDGDAALTVKRPQQVIPRVKPAKSK